VEHPPIPVSSTGVRGLAAEGKEIRSLVPDTVARYIEEHRLYL
jgi:nicotinic acid mononucleotide adenylyltransferase